MNLDRVIAVRNNKTVYRDRDRCIKVFQTGYSQSDVFCEVLNQTYAKEAGLPVPEILEVSTVQGEVGDRLFLCKRQDPGSAYAGTAGTGR